MLDFLRAVVAALVCYIQTAATLAFNAVIAAIGALWALLVSLLPDMPDVPELPAVVVTAAGYANWLFDVHWLVAYVVLYFGLIAAVLVLLIPLRWAKAAD